MATKQTNPITKKRRKKNAQKQLERKKRRAQRRVEVVMRAELPPVHVDIPVTVEPPEEVFVLDRTMLVPEKPRGMIGEALDSKMLRNMSKAEMMMHFNNEAYWRIVDEEMKKVPTWPNAYDEKCRRERDAQRADWERLSTEEFCEIVGVPRMKFHVRARIWIRQVWARMTGWWRSLLAR